MTGLLAAILVCIAGGLGAALRLVLDGFIRDRVRPSFPIGTTVINISGALLLGLLLGLSDLLLRPWLLVGGTGLLGGYTTFSTASFETVRLLEDRRYVAAVVNGCGVLIAGTAAAALGVIIGRAI